MDRSIVIIGLSRQTKVLGLPLPYYLGVMFATMLPFMWLKYMPWLLSAPLWFLLARIVTAINPNAHVVAKVIIQKTVWAVPNVLSRRNRQKERRYV